jgi:hypothetical protein
MDEDALVLNLAENQPAQVPRAIRRRVGVDAGLGFVEAMRAILVRMRIHIALLERTHLNG